MSISLYGSIDSTSPTTCSAQFILNLIIRKLTFTGEGTFKPAVPTFQVPNAVLIAKVLSPDDEMAVGSVAVPFSGTVGPDSIHITSPNGDTVVTGSLANPIDAAYEVTGTMVFGLSV